MKSIIKDAATLLAIRPLEVATYLRMGGWTETSRQKDRFSYWSKTTEKGEFEVLLPLEKGLIDFHLRMSDLLASLEIAEQRPQQQILADLVTTSADVVRLRIADGESSDGSILIEDGVRLVEQSRDLLLAAACSAVGPRSVYQTRKPTKATDYVSKLRLGQTERGSFILTIVSRVAPTMSSAGQENLFPNVEEPFERKVVQTLATALAATKHAASIAASTGSFDSFLDAVKHGVSANLCDAIVGMSGNEGGREIDFQFSWSRTRAIAPEVARDIRLSPDVIPVIREAGRIFRETNPVEDFHLFGPVTKLDRPKADARGRVTVMGFIDGNPRKIVVELEKSEYDLAIDAHKAQKNLIVTCSGDLVKEGVNFVLKSARDIKVEHRQDE